MRNKIQRSIPVDFYIGKCDVPGCTYENESQKGFYGLNSCCVCHKDICREHSECFEDCGFGDSDWSCVCPQCEPLFKEAWEWAEEYAARYESLESVALERIEELKKLNR